VVKEGSEVIMKPISYTFAAAVLPLLVACSGADSPSSADASGSQGTGASTSATGGEGAGGSAAGGFPTAPDLLALVQTCNEITNGRYKTDVETSATIPICSLQGALFWKADLDIDCDGKTTPQCNHTTDDAYFDETSATDSNGKPLDAASLPFVVVPLPSQRFDYDAAGLELGSVIAVIYKGKLRYGVFGDEGPREIIGEASYAMAVSLGIDPDPNTGGADGGVTYIAFTGASGVVGTMEDHDEAVAVGQARAARLLQEN
jgi:hypothetical protein